MKRLYSPANKILLATLALTALPLSSHAAVDEKLPAVGLTNTWDAGNHIKQPGQSIYATNQESNDKQSFTSNPDLDGAAWGHFGAWYSFMLNEDSNLKVSVTANEPEYMSPGFAVWRTDGEFDGGIMDFEINPEKSSKNINAPHAFNAIGEAGSWGTWWMTDNSVAIDPNINNGVGLSEHGIVEHLGYASDGVYQGTNGWGETVKNDGNQDGHAELTLDNMDAGWYLIFVGGADGKLPGPVSSLNIHVDSSAITSSPVPVPAAVYLFGSALAGLFMSRKKIITTG